MPLFESEDWDALLRHLSALAQDSRPLYEKVGEFLRQEWKENFAIGGRPPWIPLRASTQASKEYHGFQANALIGSGGLEQSVVDVDHPQHVHRLSKEGLEEGTSYTSKSGAPIAVYQHEGTSPYTIRPKKPGGLLRFIGSDGRFHYAREIHHPGIPARPFLDIPNTAWEQLGKQLAEMVIEGGLEQGSAA